jgi:uncharacterized membrane protein (DUF373 family)
LSEARHAPPATPARSPAGPASAGPASAGPASAGPASAGPPAGTAAEPAQRPVVAASTWVLEHAQDVVTVTVGVVLIVLAATLAVSGVFSFVTAIMHKAPRVSTATAISGAAINLLDRVLLVLILVEIVHTVVLSLRAHRLAAQPFIVVGLVAVIRRILFLLSGENTIPTAELALLIGMVVAFVAAYLAVSHFERQPGEEELAPGAGVSAGGERPAPGGERPAPGAGEIAPGAGEMTPATGNTVAADKVVASGG